MSKGTLTFLNRFSENLRRELGPDIAQEVLAGSEKFSESTDLAKMALWMNGAMARLEERVDGGQLSGFLQACGVRCADANLKSALAARKRRRAAPSLEAFVDAEIARSSSVFSRLEREGEALALYYLPARAGRMRCFCPLMRKLPADQAAPVAYCQCSRAFTQHVWETILEQPVQVEITRSALRGDSECKFVIRWGST